MRIDAALVATPGGPFEITQVDIDSPQEGEVLVRMAADSLAGVVIKPVLTFGD